MFLTQTKRLSNRIFWHFWEVDSEHNPWSNIAQNLANSAKNGTYRSPWSNERQVTLLFLRVLVCFFLQIFFGQVQSDIFRQLEVTCVFSHQLEFHVFLFIVVSLGGFSMHLVVLQNTQSPGWITSNF